MANKAHLKILEQGVVAWNEWRERNPKVKPSLSGANLKGANLEDANLYLTNLSKANLEKAIAVGASFYRANLEDANLEEAHLERAKLLWANLKGANFNGAILVGAHLEGADCQGTQFKKAKLLWSKLQGANLKGANLKGVHLDRTKLNGVSLDKTTKIDAKWRLAWEIVNQSAKGRNLKGSDLQGANLEMAILEEANLEKANLKGANLNGANLERAKLNGANLKGSSLEEANLSSARLEGANLKEAKLNGANLSKTTLGEAILGETVFWDGTNLDRAVIVEVSGPREPDLLAAKWKTLIIGGKTYHREAVEKGIEVIPSSMGEQVSKQQTERTDLEKKLTQMQSRLNELETFLTQTRDRGKVFLGHAFDDSPIVECVKDRLQQEGVPIWHDVNQLDMGDPILDVLTKGIDDSVFIAVFLSNASIKSKWVQNDLRIASKQAQKTTHKLLPILLDGVTKSQVPHYLKSLIWADLSEGSDMQIDDVVNKLVRTVSTFKQT